MTEKVLEKVKGNGKENPDGNVKPRYGPLPKLSKQRLWSRGIIIVGVLVYMWYSTKEGKEINLAKQKETLLNRGQNLECDSDYLNEIQKFPGCAPKKCGRFVSDSIITVKEAETLLSLAQRGIALGGSDGGASILDLHSGALSYGDVFINVYKVEDKFMLPADLVVYKMVKNKILHAIAENFGIDSNSLYLTSPTFFSKLNNAKPKTIHDEYWHLHIDKVTYESFHYTSLLYLTDYNIDFKGGRIIFVDDINKPLKNVTVEPRKGRVLMFTSGAENPHFVEPVTSGTRYAITVSFTCDKSKSVADPVIKH